MRLTKINTFLLRSRNKCETATATNFRYGALSGFGLSLTKWTLIVKRSADLSSAFSGRRSHHHGGSPVAADLDGSSDGTGSSSSIFDNVNSSSAADTNSWLWWLIMAFGLLICVRAIVQYLHIKRAWSGLSTAARERLFFFY